MTISPPSSDIHLADRIALRAVLVVAVLGGAVLTTLGLFTAISRVVDPSRYPVSVLADVVVPASSGGVVDARADSVLVHTTDLSAGTLWLLAGGDFCSALTIALVTFGFGSVLWRVVQRQPFHRQTYLATITAGSAIALGSLLSQGLGGLGQLAAATELSTALGGVTVPGFLFSPVPVVAGFGILALAYVFRAGAGLQRDTEGLV
ncbi:hypothetical protein B0I12_000488 [Microbacterium hydrothermale]|uniref:hypothetical protein n=1 Tax=Microbacterium hydrothermale TaxID=857427 RepID=UPI0022263AB4|nr:hypothetical protein [Microbacterium hydrothermale]MCW2163362.1 hypothetical protein [Microbacterium hydrothermale]